MRKVSMGEASVRIAQVNTVDLNEVMDRQLNLKLLCTNRDRDEWAGSLCLVNVDHILNSNSRIDYRRKNKLNALA